MSVFQLSSTNPQLGFIIGKKPPADASDLPLRAQPLRDGRWYGWYTHAAAAGDTKTAHTNNTATATDATTAVNAIVNAQEYNVLIQDVCYESVVAAHCLGKGRRPQSQDGKKNRGGAAHIDPSQYCSPYATMDCLNEAFASAFKSPHKDDLPHKFQHRFTIGMIHVNNQLPLVLRYARLLNFTLTPTPLPTSCPNPPPPAPAPKQNELGATAATITTTTNDPVQKEDVKTSATAVTMAVAHSGASEGGGDGYVSLVVGTNRTVCDLLSFVYLVGLMLVVSVEKPDFVTDGVLDHAVRILRHLQAPYTVVRQLATRVARREKVFGQYKTALEQTLSSQTTKYQHVQLLFGNSAQQRRQFILHQLLADKNNTANSGFARSIVDCGCGPGDYAVPFVKRMLKSRSPTSSSSSSSPPAVLYHAIDIDAGALDELRQKIKRLTAATDERGRPTRPDSKGLAEGVVDGEVPLRLYGSMGEYYEGYEKGGAGVVDVMVTEMIEHLSLAEAGSFLVTALSRFNFRKMIVTTPDAEFNPHLDMSTRFRHPDHKYELSKHEFQTMIHQAIKQCTKKQKLDVSFHAIGDRLNQHSITQCAVITPSAKL